MLPAALAIVMISQKPAVILAILQVQMFVVG